jgi:RNA polymerase-binding transcription factor DksA
VKQAAARTPSTSTTSRAATKATVTKTAATPVAPAAQTSSTPPKKAATVNNSRATARSGASGKATAAVKAAADAGRQQVPEARGTSKDGITYTKDFDVKFLKTQRDLLLEEKSRLLGQATRLEDEAHSLIEEAEMGDVQFDDEGGEGDTMVVERERDLALSAQARQTIADIDDALTRITAGTYGYSAVSGRPIPRERLEAIPWATELVEEKVGGIGRR